MRQRTTRFYVRLWNTFLILEVDENKLELCEFTRMVNLCQSLGLQTIFIRYNPDSYKGGTTAISKRREEWIITNYFLLQKTILLKDLPSINDSAFLRWIQRKYFIWTNLYSRIWVCLMIFSRVGLQSTGKSYIKRQASFYSHAQPC